MKDVKTIMGPFLLMSGGEIIELHSHKRDFFST